MILFGQFSVNWKTVWRGKIQWVGQRLTKIKYNVQGKTCAPQAMQTKGKEVSDKQVAGRLSPISLWNFGVVAGVGTLCLVPMGYP